MKKYAKRGAIKERAALEKGAERLKKREQSGRRRGSRAAEEEVRHTHFVYKRNARAGKWRKRAEEAERKQREGAEGSRAEEQKRSRGRVQREEPLWAIGSAEKLGYLISCHEAPTVGAVRDGRIGAVLTSRFLLKSRFSMRYYERMMVGLWVGLQQQ